MSCMNKTVTLNPQEQKRITVLNQHLQGDLSIAQVASLLDCSQRHVYRIKASYREKGVEAMMHGNRGKRSPRRISDQTRKLVSSLVQGKYAGCNQHHVRDLLEEREGMQLSRASVRRILHEAGVWVVQPATGPTHRLRRPRYRQEGQLLQIDASPHEWLQGRGPRLTLIGGIDDATGKVMGAVFREQEDQQGYMQMLRQVVESSGCPQAIYHDRHTMFPKHAKQASEADSVQEQLAGHRTETQLGRLFTQLSIISIVARSPQAKGRIERLWGTFQDRLVSELRLEGAKSLEEANVLLQAFLPRFNARFAVPAAEAALSWQAVPEGLSLDECFCLHEERTVALDNTISYHGRRVQLLPTEQRRSFARAKVCVHEHFDGQVLIFWQGLALPSRLAPADPTHLRQTAAMPVVGAEAGGEAAPAAAGAASPPASAPTSPLPTNGGMAPVSGETTAAPSSPQTHKPKAGHPWRSQAVASRSS